MAGPKKTDALMEFWGLRNANHWRSPAGKKGAIPSVKKSSVSSPKGGSGSAQKTVSKSLGKTTNLGRADFIRMVNKSPEVVVKIAKCSKDRAGIKGYMNYLSKEGTLTIEDRHGGLHDDRKSLNEMVDKWDENSLQGIPSSNGTRRETLNLVLSMEAGTDLGKMRQASSTFAAKTFPDHEYVFVAHDDTAHAHVHLVVSMGNAEGKRLNPRKNDLQNWRQSFAQELRENGIDANATPRRARGIVQKAQQTAVVQLDGAFKRGEREKPSERTLEDARLAYGEARGGIPKRTETDDDAKLAKAAIEKNRNKLMAEYKQIYTGLLESDSAEDRGLAEKLLDFVREMPSTQTRHEQRVELLSTKMEQGMLQKPQESASENPRVDRPKQRGPKL